MQVSGRGVGWEQIGEPAGVLTGDPTGESTAGFTGETTGDLGGDEAGSAARVGEETGEGLWTGAGEGHSGLLMVGDGLVFSGVGSSRRKGSGKNRLPGDFTGEGGDGDIWGEKNKKKRTKMKV